MAYRINVRRAGRQDFETLGHVLFDAVHRGASHYTAAQRQAWMPAPPSGPAWDNRLSEQFAVLAEIDRRPIGFMSLRADGYVDFAYICAEQQGRGVFRALYERLEAQARTGDLTRLWVHASLMAQPAFKAVGFKAIKDEVVVKDGQELKRAEMQKPLKAGKDD